MYRYVSLTNCLIFPALVFAVASAARSRRDEVNGPRHSWCKSSQAWCCSKCIFEPWMLVLKRDERMKEVRFFFLVGYIYIYMIMPFITVKGHNCISWDIKWYTIYTYTHIYIYVYVIYIVLRPWSYIYKLELHPQVTSTYQSWCYNISQMGLW